jgi:hypothetical protein
MPDSPRSEAIASPGFCSGSGTVAITLMSLFITGLRTLITDKFTFVKSTLN